ncbi:hypothetical protein GTP91_24840 [Rugamonas sp. FT82W]|uniref:Secretion system X translation initiation factor n=1 Tax=Duganella vulcania TaxID=2692166 RepID=A0A845GAX7_9BURK|nr:hypothetical protein [Duganella vulcania]MYM90386.1 hypothetical protein [Duganella vulcania]
MLAVVALLIWLNVSTGVERREPSAAVEPRPAERQGPTMTPRKKTHESFLSLVERDSGSGDIGNPFVAKSWYVQPPAPPPVPVAPLAPPSAPPLPFGFAGTVEAEPGHPVYYLVTGEQSYAVSKGETFAGQYRLDGVEHGQLVIIYLPLAAKQLLPMNIDS